MFCDKHGSEFNWTWFQSLEAKPGYIIIIIIIIVIKLSSIPANGRPGSRRQVPLTGATSPYLLSEFTLGKLRCQSSVSLLALLVVKPRREVLTNNFPGIQAEHLQDFYEFACLNVFWWEKKKGAGSSTRTWLTNTCREVPRFRHDTGVLMKNVPSEFSGCSPSCDSQHQLLTANHQRVAPPQ